MLAPLTNVDSPTEFFFQVDQINSNVALDNTATPGPRIVPAVLLGPMRAGMDRAIATSAVLVIGVDQAGLAAPLVTQAPTLLQQARKSKTVFTASHYPQKNRVPKQYP